MDYEKLHKDTLAGLQRLVFEGKITEETARSICADFVAESEDERIVTRLINLLNTGGYLEEPDRTKVLAWLERQKEQKPVHTAKEMWKEMRLEVYAQASGNRHEPNYSDDSTKMFSLCDIDEIFEKIGNSTVGSQPAEWSEEDSKLLNRTLSIIRWASDSDRQNRIIGDAGAIELEDWLKSKRPQKTVVI